MIQRTELANKADTVLRPQIHLQGTNFQEFLLLAVGQFQNKIPYNFIIILRICA